MRKGDLEMILEEVAELSGSRVLMVVGSQALHAAADRLPETAEVSNEVDVLLEDETNLAIVEERLGEQSKFHEKHFCYAHILENAAALPFPVDWRENGTRRTIRSGGKSVECVFMSPEDLCVSKLAVGRKKDLEFVFNLLSDGIVETPRIRERIEKLPEEYQKSAAEYTLQKVVNLKRTPSFKFGEGFDL